MDLRELLYKEANTFFESYDDEEEVKEPVNIEDLADDPDIPAYLRKPMWKDRGEDTVETGPEPVDMDDLEEPAYKRLPKRTDHSLPVPKKEDPIDNVPEDEEVPKFLRDRGAKVFPDDIEKPAFARKKSAEIAKAHGIDNLKRI